MKRLLLTGMSVAATAAALAAPSSAMADTAGANVCDGKPLAQCVNDTLRWLVTYDPCLGCVVDEELEAAMRTVRETCSKILASC